MAVAFSSSIWTLYVNATDGFDMVARSTVNSSGLSPMTGWMKVLLGPMASRFGKLLIRIVPSAISNQHELS